MLGVVPLTACFEADGLAEEVVEPLILVADETDDSDLGAVEDGR